MNKIYMTIPNNHGECPVCNGTGRYDAGAIHYHASSGYDAVTHTLRCSNCGGQTMYGEPTGIVRLNKKGEPCRHKYTSRNASRSYFIYTCSHCGHEYDIDSGD